MGWLTNQKSRPPRTSDNSNSSNRLLLSNFWNATFFNWCALLNFKHFQKGNYSCFDIFVNKLTARWRSLHIQFTSSRIPSCKMWLPLQCVSRHVRMWYKYYYRYIHSGMVCRADSWHYFSSSPLSSLFFFFFFHASNPTQSLSQQQQLPPFSVDQHACMHACASTTSSWHRAAPIPLFSISSKCCFSQLEWKTLEITASQQAVQSSARQEKMRFFFFYFFVFCLVCTRTYYVCIHSKLIWGQE